MDTPYQVMPDLTIEEFEALKADIAEYGVLVPVEYDDQGNILDGYHRARAWEELQSEGFHLPEFPRVVREGMNDEEKRSHARKLNLTRRHLNRFQRREILQQQLKETPQKSDRQLASILGVDHKTVGAVRRHLEGIGEIPQSDRETIDGRVYPASREMPFDAASNLTKTIKLSIQELLLSVNDALASLPGTFTATGWLPPEDYDMPFEEWKEMGKVLQGVGRLTQYLRGEELESETPLSRKQAQNLAYETKSALTKTLEGD